MILRARTGSVDATRELAAVVAMCVVMLVIPSSAISSAWWHLRAVAIPRPRASATTPVKNVLVPCGFAA